MSYLLTEIALEMLGYKFYDPSGEFHLINFQEPLPIDLHPGETKLENFINHPSTSTFANGNGHPSIPYTNGFATAPTISLQGAPVRAFTKLIKVSDTIKWHKGSKKLRQKLQSKLQAKSQPIPMPKLQPITQNKVLPSMNVVPLPDGFNVPGLIMLPKMTIDPRRTPTKALAKVVSYEIRNIRNELTHRLDHSMAKETGTPTEDALLKCVSREIKKIKADAHVVTEFRTTLEKYLKPLDVCRYESYIRTFGGE